MAGVRDKLFLPLHIPDFRLNDPEGKNAQDQERGSCSENSKKQGDEQDPCVRIELAAAVEEGDFRAAVRFMNQIIVISAAVEAAVGLYGGFCVLDRLRLRKGGDMTGHKIRRLHIIIECHIEISCLIAEFGRTLIPFRQEEVFIQEGSRIFFSGGDQLAVVIQNEIQCFEGFMACGGDIDRVDQPADKRHHAGKRKKRNQDKTPAKFIDGFLVHGFFSPLFQNVTLLFISGYFDL